MDLSVASQLTHVHIKGNVHSQARDCNLKIGNKLECV
uniref:Uncharacterized protein n=1 Tax=Anguilla anguilla TaxID=7936 RepID=A0A0E9XV79_ANGAN